MFFKESLAGIVFPKQGDIWDSGDPSLFMQKADSLKQTLETPIDRGRTFSQGQSFFDVPFNPAVGNIDHPVIPEPFTDGFQVGAKRFREIERENSQIKKLVADLSLANAVLKEVAQSKL